MIKFLHFKNRSGFYILTLAIAFSLNTNAQTNRANDKKSIAYRSNYQRLAPGCATSHRLEIRGGTLWACGSNSDGQLGIGTSGLSTNKSSPVQVGTDNKWVRVAAGYSHSAGIKSDGTLWTWGDNSNGELGDGTSTAHSSPVQIGTDTKWISVSAATEHTIALKSDGTLWAWGYNIYGQLGDGTTTTRTSPVQIGTDTKWVSVSAGYYHNLALKSDGTLWAWGRNHKGQIGDGTLNDRIAPFQVGSGTNWTNTIIGGASSFGIKSDGTLWAWGSNNFGQLGDGTSTNRLSPVQSGTDDRWVLVSAGDGHTLGLKSDGTIWGWGQNNNGQVGDGTTSPRISAVQIGTDSKWVNVTAGYFHSLAFKSDGTSWAWGTNSSGQYGDGTTTQKNSPSQTGTALDVWINISAGSAHTLALRSNGYLLAWGENSNGKLGDGTTTNRIAPVQVGTDNKWVSITAGYYHSLGIKSDGTLWSWGDNTTGCLGIGNTTNQNTPAQVTSVNWVSVAAGSGHTLALRSDGTLWAWGWNYYGQLGDGTTTQRNSPVQVGTDNKWVKISTGATHSLALKSDGTLWVWGRNDAGQLGDGSITNLSVPTQIGSDNKWINIQAGFSHTMGLKSDGTLWAWGKNDLGQLGDGTLVGQTIPVQIGTDKKWISISAHGSHSIGLKSDGTYWAWGFNNSGELGDGTNTNTNAPSQIGNATTWIASSAGSNYSIRLSADRIQYCATGGNTYGQLGDSTTTGRNTFNCLSAGCVKPPAPASSNKTICSNNRTTLSATITGVGGWYLTATGNTWLGGGATYLTPVLNGTMTFYVQDSTCAASATRTPVVVTVNPSPSANVGPPKSICKGDSVSIGPVTVNGNTYTWSSKPAGFTSVISNPKVSPAVTTTYYLTETITSSGCSRIDSVKITVSNPPAAITGGAKTICSGVSISIGGSPVTGNIYSWTSSPPGFTSAIANPTITPAVTTTYFLKETSSGCSKTDSVLITVNPLPTVTAGNAKTICNGESVQLGTIAINGNTYTWTSIPAGFTSASANPVVTPSITTKYRLTQSITSTGCSKSDSVIITVKPLPDITTSVNINTITANATGASYQWLKCPAYSIIAGATNQSYLPSANGDYAVIVTSNGCSDTSVCVPVSKIGIDKKTNDVQAIKVYPNPNKGTFIIKSGSGGVYCIINELGQTIKVVVLNHLNNYSAEINNLSNGIYFITGLNDGHSVACKVVVME